MRRIHGLVIAGMFLFAACGGGGNKTATGSTGSTGGSSSSASGGGSGSSFCKSFQKIVDGVGNKDVTTDPKLAKQVVNAIKGLKPPGEIANEWKTFVAYIEAVSNVSSSDPAAASKVLGGLDGKLNDITKVGTYLGSTCQVPEFSGASDMSSLSDMSSSSYDSQSLDSMLSSMSERFSDFSSFSDFSTPSN